MDIRSFLQTSRPVSAPRAAVAGAIAAAAALATGELVCAIGDSQPSLVTAVGDEFIDRFAARLKDVAVRLFGTNDKVALVAGVVVTSIVLGAVFGLAARRKLLVGVGGFVAFGLVGLWAYQRAPLGSTATGYVAALLAVVAGVAVLYGLFVQAGAWSTAGTTDTQVADSAWSPARSTSVTDGVATPDGIVVAPTSPMPKASSTRRGFIVTAAALAAASGGVAVLGRRIKLSDGNATAAVRQSTSIPRAANRVAPPADQPFEVEGLSSFLTPNDNFYRIDTALAVPQVDAATWSMSITGMVDNPLTITYDELLAMGADAEAVTIQCVSNEVGGNLVGTAEWQGVPLATLLEKAGVQDGATQIVGRSVDGWTAGFPTEAGLDGRTALVAYAMNGEPLPVPHGYPARLIVAGLYGYVSATKWLSEIELTTWDAFDGYWVPRGWSKEGPIKTSSRIDVPAGGASLAAGRQAIAGVAWAPTEGISKVEVAVDGEWHECELGNVANGNTWVQWYYAWDAEAGDHEIMVRATNADGETQTSDVARPAPNGSTGWHSRRVTVSA